MDRLKLVELMKLGSDFLVQLGIFGISVILALITAEIVADKMFLVELGKSMKAGLDPAFGSGDMHRFLSACAFGSLALLSIGVQNGLLNNQKSTQRVY